MRHPGRRVLQQILVWLVTAGCGACSAGDAVTAPWPALAGTRPLPELAELASAKVAVPKGGKAVSTFMFRSGAEFEAGLPHPDVMAVGNQGIFSTVGAEGSYALYSIPESVLGAGQRLLNVSVSYSYNTDPDPQPNQGLYLAFANYASGRWVWLGRAAAGGDLLDCSAKNLPGRVGPGLLAIYHYGSRPLALDSFIIEVSNREELLQGAFVYYTGQNPLAPPGRFSIYRVPADQPGNAEEIVPGGDTRWYSRPQIALYNGQPALYLIRWFKTATPPDLMVAQLDGTLLDPLLSLPDATPGAISPDGRLYAYTQFEVLANAHNIYGHDFQTGGGGKISAENVSAGDLAWWGDTPVLPAFYLLARQTDPLAPASGAIAIFYAPPGFPQSEPAGQLFSKLSPGENQSSPAAYSVPWFGGVASVVLFAASGRTDASANLYRGQLGSVSPHNVVNLAIDPSVELVSPAASADGQWLAFIAKSGGSDVGFIRIMPLAVGGYDSAISLGGAAVGETCWYLP